MEPQIGEKRKFSFSDKQFSIREIMLNPKITMWWKWNGGLCPHCKQPIDRNIEHVFYRIEILGVEEKEDKDLKLKDVFLLGFTMDLRIMALTAEKYKEVLEKSDKFKHLALEVK